MVIFLYIWQIFDQIRRRNPFRRLEELFRRLRRVSRPPLGREQAVVKARRTDGCYKEQWRYGRYAFGDEKYCVQYYVQFELKTGRLMELEVSAKEYGRIHERDRGTLEWQGDCFVRFHRQNYRKPEE
ncbi:MAG: DUF2500 family protein [Oscillospiraceae bacterium]